MSAFIFFSKEITLTIPEVLGIGSFLITFVAVLIKIFLLIKASEKTTDEKIGNIESKLTTKISTKVSAGHFETEINRVDSRIDENKDNVAVHFKLLRQDNADIKKSLEVLTKLHLKE